MTIFCKAMHKHAELIPHFCNHNVLICNACYMLRSDPQTVPTPERDRDVTFDEKHDFEPHRAMGVDLAEPGSETTVTQIWADTQPKLPPKMLIRCTGKEDLTNTGMNSVMRGFRCIQPNKTRLPFWAPYQNWADLVCPHCSSSVSQGLTSGHHEMDGASPITLAMLRKEVPADDLRFAEPCPTRHMPNSIGQAGEIALKEATGHVERLLGHFTTQDFTSGNPDKRRALVNAINWLNDNK